MQDERTLFGNAVALAPGERSSYLDRAAGNDADLRRRVEALLAAHDKACGILDVTPPGLTAVTEAGTEAGNAPPPPASSAAGTTVGAYRLLELIGEGGMGAVYMAEQQRPVRRTVALKIIKPGMDTKQAIARFEAERQALALMDHPNIAKVLDAGSTDAGRLYFVMELVKGVPITEYCDRNRLTPRQRLELFAAVCQAVQHAHQKGVIHRDIKPSNVLVAVQDGEPVPKVIDFGIAKATQGRLTDLTLFTNFAQVVGSPMYMSPEQAASAVDVDTRSDVYSLGVLLYELVTGTTPFDKQRLGKAAWDEVRRIIREEEPPKPSTRISTLGATLPAVSSSRGTEPKKLGQVVWGELDWIVMKALDKDRTRRYETANGLAADVRRYLADEPVAACPPSSVYRLRKLARKHKAAAAAAAAVFVSLSLGLGLATSAWVRARHDRNAAVRARAVAEASELRARSANDFLKDMLASADPWHRRGRNITVRQVLDRAAAGLDRGQLTADPAAEAEARLTVGRTYAALGVGGAAERHLKQSVAQLRRLHGPRHPSVADALAELGQLRLSQGEYASAESLLREALALADQAPSRAGFRVTVLSNLGKALHKRGDAAAAEPLLREAVATTSAAGDGNRQVADALQILADVLHGRGKLDEAEATCLRALDTHRHSGGEESPAAGSCLVSLGLIRSRKGDRADAIRHLVRALDVYRKALGDDHPTTLDCIERLVGAHQQSGDNRAVARVLTEQRSRLEANADASAEAHVRLSKLESWWYDLEFRWADAETARRRLRDLSPRWLDEQIERKTDLLGDTREDAKLMFERGMLHGRRGRFREAADDVSRAVELDPGHASWWHQLACLLAYLGEDEAYRRTCREALARFADAEDWVTNEQVSKACLLLAPAEAADLARASRMAAKAVDVGGRAGQSAWPEFAAALAEYRQGEGHYEAALRFMARSQGTIRHEEAQTAMKFIRAMVFYRMGRVAEARAHLATTVQRFDDRMLVAQRDDLDVNGGGLNNWLILHVIRREAEKLIGPVPPEQLAVHRRRREVAQLGAEELFAAARARPDDPVLLGRRADLYGRQGRFAEAADDYALLVKLEPLDFWHWFHLACLLAHLGREPAYQHHCQAMARQWSETVDMTALDVTTKGSLLLPGGAGGDVDVLAERADRLFRLDPENAWAQLLKGMAEYRARRFETAISPLRKCVAAAVIPARAVAASAFLAMSHHQLGQKAEARATLDRCVADAKKGLPRAGADEIARLDQWLVADVARREAEAVVGGK